MVAQGRESARRPVTGTACRLVGRSLPLKPGTTRIAVQDENTVAAFVTECGGVTGLPINLVATLANFHRNLS